jgi:hypothetical protein
MSASLVERTMILVDVKGTIWSNHLVVKILFKEKISNSIIINYVEVRISFHLNDLL